jgi:hypothetical protein
MENPQAQKQKLLEMDRKHELDVAEENVMAQEFKRLLEASAKGKDATFEAVVLDGDVHIRVRTMLTGELEQICARIARTSKLAQEDPSKAADMFDDVYRLVAGLCADDGWNDPETWRTYHGKTSSEALYHVLEELIKPSGHALDAARSFRAERRGT